MVERSHTAGWWPPYKPPRGIDEKVADWFTPRADAADGDGFYEICMELPGVAADDIDISFHEDHLTIKGKKHHPYGQKNRSYFFAEREYGAFQRSFRLPVNAEAEYISSDFKNGLLTVRVPKVGPPPDRIKHIKIRTG